MAVGEQETEVGPEQISLPPPAVLHAPHLLDAFDRSPASSLVIAQRGRPPLLETQLDRRRLVQQS
jgi:hypothetical protein